MFNSRALIIALIFANLSASSVRAMNQGFYPTEPACLGDRDATYTYMVDHNGKRQQKVQKTALYDFRDPCTKQLFDYVTKNDQVKLKDLLDESAVKGSLNMNAELNGLCALEVAMLSKNHAVASILLLYGANLEHVRCREHRAILRLLKNQAEAVARAPRARARNRAGDSERNGQSPSQSGDEKENDQENQELNMLKSNRGSRNSETRRAHSQQAALLRGQKPSDDQAGEISDQADYQIIEKMDVGCTVFGSKSCSIQ
jgi:hypothetical protein